MEVCNQLIDYAIANKTHIIFIGTTNTDIYTLFNTGTQDHKNKPLAPALLSRFTSKIKIENPAPEHRQSIIEDCIAALKASDQTTAIFLNQEEKDRLVKLTHGFSIRDINTVFKLARQYTFASNDTNTQKEPVLYRQLRYEHIANAVEIIKKGKRIQYMHTAAQWVKNIAIHGAPWLNLAHAVYSNWIHGLQHDTDILRNEKHRLDDRIYDLSKLHNQLEREYCIRHENDARHAFERVEDRSIQDDHSNTDFNWQLIHTVISLVGLLK